MLPSFPALFLGYSGYTPVRDDRWVQEKLGSTRELRGRAICAAGRHSQQTSTNLPVFVPAEGHYPFPIANDVARLPGIITGDRSAL